MSEHQKKRDFIPKKEVKKQLDDLAEQGLSLHYEKDVPLTPQDISLIKRLFLRVTLFFIILSIPFVVVVYFFPEKEIVLVINCAMLLFFIFAITRAAFQVGSNLRAGNKTLVKGIITDRFTKKEFGIADEDGKRSETVVNYLQIGTREFKVDRLIYKKYRIGDAIELHFIVSQRNKPYFLHHCKLKEAGLRSDV
ncbi:MAG: hypothetical protein AABY93_14450 [Bacteroidota bacterium]